MESRIRLHLIFHSQFIPFLYLKWLRRPIVYSIVSGLGERSLFQPRSLLHKVNKIVVTNQHDVHWLAEKGFDRVVKIRPGIDSAPFHYSAPPNNGNLVLMAGSAPWTPHQFYTKGIDTLLHAARKLPHLRIIFLWRGVLYDEMMHRVHQMQVANRIEVLNEHVDVNQVLGRVHATVLISNTSRHVKAYPHSLLESLAAGKPVITSTSIPINEYVQERQCGLVIHGVDLDEFLNASQELEEKYGQFRDNARVTTAADFSLSRMLAEYEEVFNQVSGL